MGKKAIQLATAVYQLTQKFPREELFGLTTQMRRAAVTISSNIAEGHGRFRRREYRQFLSLVRGSKYELQTQFEIARSLGDGARRELDNAETLSQEIGKMIYAIAAKLTRPVTPVP